MNDPESTVTGRVQRRRKLLPTAERVAWAGVWAVSVLAIAAYVLASCSGPAPRATPQPLSLLSNSQPASTAGQAGEDRPGANPMPEATSGPPSRSAAQANEPLAGRTGRVAASAPLPTALSTPVSTVMPVPAVMPVPSPAADLASTPGAHDRYPNEPPGLTIHQDDIACKSHPISGPSAGAGSAPGEGRSGCGSSLVKPSGPAHKRLGHRREEGAEP